MNFVNLFYVFFKIGALSFGGGYSMIPFFEKEIAVHHWAVASDYTKVIALAQIIPGPFAIDSSTYIGFKVAGIWGAVVASLALSLPSFIALVLITKYYLKFKSNTGLQKILKCFRPAVVALLLSAMFIIGFQPFVNNPLNPNIVGLLKSLLIVVPGFWAHYRNKINPFLLIFLSGVAGIILY